MPETRGTLTLCQVNEHLSSDFLLLAVADLVVGILAVKNPFAKLVLMLVLQGVHLVGVRCGIEGIGEVLVPERLVVAINTSLGHLAGQAECTEGKVIKVGSNLLVKLRRVSYTSNVDGVKGVDVPQRGATAGSAASSRS